MKTPCNVTGSIMNRHTNPRRFFCLLGLLIAIIAFTQLPAFAQFASGSIGATVTDSTGGVVPTAKVVLKNEATGVTRDSVTNSAGYFDFPSVLPGSYTVTITSKGLRTVEQTGIVVTQGATLRLPEIVLQIQSLTQEIEVVAAAALPGPVASGTSSQLGAARQAGEGEQRQGLPNGNGFSPRDAMPRFCWARPGRPERASSDKACRRVMRDRKRTRLNSSH